MSLQARRSWLSFIFLFILVLASCAKDETARPPAGTGGSGGTGGTGGSGGGPTVPTWEGKSPVSLTSWRTMGEITLWRRANLGPEGRPGFIYAGHGIGAIAEDGTPLWQVDAGEDGSILDPILDLVTVRLEGDSDHVLATTVRGDALLLSGADGSLVWSRALSYHDERRAELVLLGDEDEPLFFSAFGKSIHYVRTGERAWNHGLESPVLFAHSLSRGEGQAPLVILAIDPGPDRPEEKPDLFAFTVDGEPVFSASSERYVTSLTSIPHGEEGGSQLLVGTNEDRLVAFSPDGRKQWVRSLGDGKWNSAVYDLLIADVDGDGSPEFFADVYELVKGSTLVSLDEEGEERFRVDLPGRSISLMEWMETGEGPRLVVAFRSRSGATDLATLDAGTGEDLQEVAGLRAVTGLFPTQDRRRLFIGTADGRGTYLEGSHSTEHGVVVGSSVLHAVPGKGETLLVTLAGGAVASVGQPRVEWSLPIDPSGRTLLGGSRFYEEEGRGILALSGAWAWDEEDRSSLGFYFVTEDGERLASLSTSRGPAAFSWIDLDGRGPMEFVAVHFPEIGSQDCTLAAYDREKEELVWEAELTVCGTVSLDVGDTKGDERPEVAVAGFALEHLAFAALVDAKGSLRWMHRFHYVPLWALALSGGAAFGGAADDGNGFVIFYDAESGEKRWETKLSGLRDSKRPRESRNGFSHFATAVADRNGDGFDEIALTTEAGEVYLLDGATGAIEWRAWIREEGTTVSGGGGPIVYVPETESIPAYLVASEREDSAVTTTTSVFDLEGNRRGSFLTRGGVASLTRRRVEGEWRVATGERFGTQIIAVRENEPKEDEEPTE